MKKIITFVLLVCFINLTIRDIYAYSITTLTSNKVFDRYNTNNFVPIDFGKSIEDVYIAGNKTIINILDLHSDTNTQKNIISILDFLVNNYNISNIYVEGAIGNLDVNWLSTINDSKLNKSVIERLLKDGKITGTEYFALINKNKNIQFKGLEEKQIYKENFEILENLYINSTEIKNKITAILNELASNNNIYNYKIKQLNYITNKYKQNNIDIGQYYSYLINFLNKTNIDITYKTILNFLNLEQSYDKINEKKLKHEIVQINSKLKSNLNYDKYSTIQNLFQSHQNEYYDELFKFILYNKIEYKYGEFIKFYNYLQEKKTIDTISLLQEENDLLNRLYNYYSRTSKEKELLFLNIYTEKLLLFLTNNLTAIDYNYITNNFNRYVILLQNYIIKTDIMQIKQWYKLANKFYTNNEKRNKYFIENIYNRKLSKKDFINDSIIKNNNRKNIDEILKITKQPIDIIITGGYHSNGLKKLMKELNINYVVIMPNVNLSSIKESKNTFYNDYQKQYSIISNTYQKFIRSSMMNETWEDPTKIIVGAFIDYSLLDELYKNLKSIKNIQNIISTIQKYLVDIFNKKGMNVSLKLLNIEITENNSFLLTVSDNSKSRMFFISKDIIKEVFNKSEIKSLENSSSNKEKSTIKTANKSRRLKKILTQAKIFFTTAMLLPLNMIMGNNIGIGGKKIETYKELIDNGANINVITPETISYTDTIFDTGAIVNLDGNIKLNSVYVGKGNKLNLKAGVDTTITIENIDLSDIGALDITIEDKGDFKIVRENSVIKVYKVLKTDFTSSQKEKVSIVSVLNKGKLIINSEHNWSQTNNKPIIVFYEKGTSLWRDISDLEARSNLIYKDCKVIYIDISSISNSSFSSKFEINEEMLQKLLKEHGFDNKDICIDTSLIKNDISQSIYSSLNLFTHLTNSITLLYTNIPYRTLFPVSYSTNRENKHFYINSDGDFIRYPYKDRTWLQSILKQYFPSFNRNTFVFVWPVESAKHTYTPNKNFGGTPERRISAFEPFKIFMDKAKEYTSKNKDTIVFLPGYLMSELSTYFGDGNISSKFIDITYGNNPEASDFGIWYKTELAKEMKKIELLKIDGLTIVVYPEGNRGHNEQAYLDTLMATYNYGKESLDGMLTQAGFSWKRNTIYVYEGKEMQNLDIEQQLLQNPSIKKGKVSYVYENLKRVFINLYSNMKRFFSTIIPKYTKGNWIAIENKVINSINIDQLKENLTAKSKLGFDSIMLVPVQTTLLDELYYGYPTILEQNGIEIPVYSVGDENGTIYLIGVSDDSIKWQQAVLLFIKDSLNDYKNNIVSFNGLPQISSQQTTSLLGNSFISVVLNKNSNDEKDIERLGYDTIINTEDTASRVENAKLKYPHVAEDMLEISETIKIIKTLKKKSFFGKFDKYKTSYVGTKIASDEHIFNSELEEKEFIQILSGTDIDFVTVVIRDNDLGVKVLGRETTVKENLTKLSQNLHNNNKKILLEYTFSFIDDFFKTFTRTIGEDCKDINIDGIKLDLANCNTEDIKKAMNDLKRIRETLKDKEISVQVTSEVWEQYETFFEELNITRTVSSKEELLLANYNLDNAVDINYEISIYKDQKEYEDRLHILSLQTERLEDRDPSQLSNNMRMLLEQGEEKFLDQAIDRRLESILQKVVTNKSIGKLIIPVNMLYAQRLKDNENSNVIQAVSNLIRLFKETKGMKERRQFAYEYGLQQQVNLTNEQEIEISKILRGESNYSAGNYVRRYYPYVFDYFVESRQTRIEISDSFLFGIYEANIIRKYKEGEFGKVLQFVKDSSIYQDTEEKAIQRQQIFYRILAQTMLYKDKDNLKLNEKELIFYEDNDKTTELENNFNLLTGDLKNNRKLYTGSKYFTKCFSVLTKTTLGYMPDRENTLYQARLLMTILFNAYATEEIEPILPIITSDQIKAEDITIKDSTTFSINKLLSSA